VTIVGDGSFVAPFYVISKIDKKELPEQFKKLWDE